MVKATEKKIHLVRHAQAEHNVADDYSIRDAPLTALGRKQAAALNEVTKGTIQRTAELLVTSAMRRPLSTTLIAFPELRNRLEAQGQNIVILPQLQECGDLPCDTGSPREVLEADPEYAGLDFSLLTPDWTSKEGFYATTALQARARWNRRWLRERPEREIVVVAHADCLRYIAHGYNSSEQWGNAEMRTYTFEHEDEQGAWLVPVQNSEMAQEPTSSEMENGK